MGTQQLLLIALVVVLVGIAVAVGIYMFNVQAFNANRQAILVELATLNAKAVEYWKLPVSMGGAGGDVLNATTEGLAAYLGFTAEPSKMVSIDYMLFSENAEFHLNSLQEADMEIEALGTATLGGKFPHVSQNVNLIDNEDEIEIEKSKVFKNGNGHSNAFGHDNDNHAGGNGGGNGGGNDDDDDGNGGGNGGGNGHGGGNG